MFLTKTQRHALDAAIAMEQPNAMYITIPELANKLGLSSDRTSTICASLAADGLVIWADRQHYTYVLSEKGRNYKELIGLERKEKVSTILLSAVTSTLCTLLTTYLAGWLQL